MGVKHQPKNNFRIPEGDTPAISCPGRARERGGLIAQMWKLFSGWSQDGRRQRAAGRKA